MKKYSVFFLSAILTLSVFAVAPQMTNAQGAGLVSAIISKMDRNRRSLLSLRSEISMERYNAQTRESDRLAGTVAYKPGKGRNSNVRVEWTSPVNEILAVNEGSYTLYRPRLNMAYVGNANSSRNKVGSVLGFGLDVSGAQLHSAYDVQFLEKETLYGGVATDHLKLVPKNGARYKYAEIWVDETGMPVQTKVVERNGDATTIRLSSIQRNAKVSSDDFKLRLPSDVKTVKG